MTWTASVTSCCWLAYASPRDEVQERFLSMFSRTDGNCVRAFMLGSQGCLSTSFASSSPLRLEWLCIHRSASTISLGYVEAARICATRASGYKAMGATSCCSSWGECCTGAAGDCSLDWPVGPKDSACAVNRTSKQQRSKDKICLDNFMANSPVQNCNHLFSFKSVIRKLHSSSSSRQGASLAAKHTRRDVIAAGQLFQCIELRLCFVRALLKEFNASLRSDTHIAFIYIYPARGFPETSRIFKRLLVFMELSSSAFKFISQLRCLLGIPLRVLGFHIRCRRGCRG